MEEVKKGKKKNKVASLLLALALILTCGVAGTIAQYQKSFGGTGTATIAKFDVDATNLKEDQTKGIDLFETVKDTKDGNDEKDVHDNMIAPGTQGSFRVDLTNKSEVNVKYQLYAKWSETSGKHSVSVDGVDTEMPLTFKLVAINGTEEATIANELSTAMNDTTGWYTIDELNQPANEGKIPSGDLAMETGKKTVYLCWQWAYTTGDADSTEYKARNKLDTAIGEAMKDSSTQLKPVVEVGVTFTQVD